MKKLYECNPYKIIEENKIVRLTFVNFLSESNLNVPFIDHIIICDEKWADYDDSRRSGQWVEADKPGEIKSLKKILITVS